MVGSIANNRRALMKLIGMRQKRTSTGVKSLIICSMSLKKASAKNDRIRNHGKVPSTTNVTMSVRRRVFTTCHWNCILAAEPIMCTTAIALRPESGIQYSRYSRLNSSEPTGSRISCRRLFGNCLNQRWIIRARIARYNIASIGILPKTHRVRQLCLFFLR